MGSTLLLSAAARRLEGKVAIITGGAGGIGSSAAKLFCQHGAKVLIADIQDDQGRALCKELGPSSASYIHCDVTSDSDMKNAVDKAVADHGKLDIMFNNAGIAGVIKTNILENDNAEFEEVLRVNVKGVFLGTKHAARVMVPARGGSIINTASSASMLGGGASHAYTCSKHAVLGLTRNTAVELGKFGIRVNCVSPYLILTPLARRYLNLREDDPADFIYYNLKGARLQAEDVAKAALYLGSEDARYVSGHNLAVDGGFTALNKGFVVFEE